MTTHSDIDLEVELRDYFAAQALTGLLASNREFLTIPNAPTITAEAAYDFADAMLNRRKIQLNKQLKQKGETHHDTDHH